MHHPACISKEIRQTFSVENTLRYLRRQNTRQNPGCFLQASLASNANPPPTLQGLIKCVNRWVPSHVQISVPDYHCNSSYNPGSTHPICAWLALCRSTRCYNETDFKLYPMVVMLRADPPKLKDKTNTGWFISMGALWVELTTLTIPASILLKSKITHSSHQGRGSPIQHLGRFSWMPLCRYPRLSAFI